MAVRKSLNFVHAWDLIEYKIDHFKGSLMYKYDTKILP